MIVWRAFVLASGDFESTRNKKGGVSMFRRIREADWRTVAMFGLFVIWLVAMVLYIVARPINKVTNVQTIEGTVTEKTVKNSGKSGKYMVFIEDETGKIIPLGVTDSLLRLRFDSSDVWGNLHEGEKYRFEVGGSRWEILSWYPNIYSYEEITTE